ncbi:DUF5667 domain-containing protein [Streptomyces cavernicola]|uniref:DUF5667 domain-containing protein n=1 Tax=Streptomyces cavernicola TaxID=3043613 RepID=A0ABT6SL76_9ACTN|nr:DUF5667 domain-containing protein [Streptomyces sp. B-S-A6]MDI3408824.1 DUF5667 domain-containing protein [Streptomyces sp. B-S-A6]
MIANVSAHRRANAFAQALEEQSDQAAAAEQPESTEDSPAAEQAARSRMLALAGGLGELPKPELDPEVKVVQRAQLMAAMEAMLQEGTAAGGDGVSPSVPEQREGKGSHRAGPLRKLRPRSRLSKGIAAGGLTVGVAAGAFSGVAAASSDALPGDSLYGLKRGMEDLKLDLADDDSARGELYLNQASTRLQEARRLMERGRVGELDHESLSEVRRTLGGVRNDASEGHRLLHAAYQRDGSIAPIQALNSFSQAHRDSWSALRDRLPLQLSDVGDEVSSVFDAIDEEVEPLKSLFPRSPETGGSTSGSSSPDTGATGKDDAEQSPDDGTGSSPSGSSDSKPKPSSSSSEEEGLIGGGAGDLLDPPLGEGDSAGPSDGKATPDKPDITLPPVLPGLLPGLGIEGEDTTK